MDATTTLAGRVLGMDRGRSAPLIVAIDGRSGAGKSTLAKQVSALTGAAVVEGDEFYAGGTSERWDAMAPSAMVDHCIDWRRQRPVLEALAQGREASWRGYDWIADDGRLARRATTCVSHRIVLLEGAYSARPELADLLDLRVLVDTPRATRRARLLLREGGSYRGDWEARWSSAEDHYFAFVMPHDSFDLIVV